MSTPLLASPELRLLCAWLAWPSRLLGHSYEDGDLPSWNPDDDLAKRFLDEVHRPLFVHHTIDNLRAIANIALGHSASHLLDWHRKLIEAVDPGGLGMATDAERPRWTPEVWLRWRELSAWVSTDTLICLQLAARQAWRTAWSWTTWKSLPGVKHPVLEDMLLQQGLYDNHIHMGGAYDKHLAWLHWLWGFTPDQRALQPRFYLSPAGGGTATSDLVSADQVQRESERRLFATVREAFDDLLRSALRSFGDIEVLLASCNLRQLASDHGKPTHADGERMYRLERLVIAHGWHQLLEGARSSVSTCSSGSKSLQLDRYLSGRQFFLRESQQYPQAGTPPGLSVFRDYLERARGHERWEANARRQARKAVGGPLQHLGETRHAALEVRLAPMLEVHDYKRFFVEIGESAKRGALPPGLRFVVHFIRQPLATKEDWWRLRVTLDRATAVLHRFRLANPRLARWIAGIDVANGERDCPPAALIPYLRLLRRPHELMNSGPSNPMHKSPDRWSPVRGMERWQHMLHHDIPLSAPGAGDLGLTYHIGEDTPHPVDGMRQMADLLDYGDLQRGDRLGHGLAIGLQSPELNRQQGEQLIRCWDALQDLLWLWQGVRGEDPSVCHLLEERRDQVCMDAFGCSVNWQQLQALRDDLHRNPLELPRPAGDDLSVIGRPDGKDRSAGHDRFVRASTVFVPTLEPAVHRSRQRLIARLDALGIIIEMAPSSNWATLRLPHLDDHPLLRSWMNGERQLRLSVATDDPGVFHTRADVELALLWASLQRSGLCEADIESTMTAWMVNTRRSLFGDPPSH